MTEEGRRGDLIREAARLFREMGYERTTVRDLAETVGLLSGSLFHHFKSKQDILVAVMEEAIVTALAEMKARVTSCTSPLDKVFALIQCELKALHGETRDGFTVLVYEWRSLEEENRKKILLLRDEYESLWKEALSEAWLHGLIKNEPRVLRLLLIGALRWTVQWFDPSGRVQLDQLAEHVWLLASRNGGIPPLGV